MPYHIILMGFETMLTILIDSTLIRIAWIMSIYWMNRFECQTTEFFAKSSKQSPSIRLLMLMDGIFYHFSWFLSHALSLLFSFFFISMGCSHFFYSDCKIDMSIKFDRNLSRWVNDFVIDFRFKWIARKLEQINNIFRQ